jgi:hypothetical protein
MLWAREAWFIFLSALALTMGWYVGKRLPNALSVVPVAVAAGFALTLWIGTPRVDRGPIEHGSLRSRHHRIS